MALIHTASALYGMTMLVILVLASQAPGIDKLEAALMSLMWPVLILISMLVMLYNIVLGIK
jgi:hypothetical protein